MDSKQYDGQIKIIEVISQSPMEMKLLFQHLRQLRSLPRVLGCLSLLSILLLFNLATFYADHVVSNDRSTPIAPPALHVELVLTHHCGEHLIKHLLKRYSQQHNLLTTSIPPLQFKYPPPPSKTNNDINKGVFSVEVEKEGHWKGEFMRSEGNKHGEGVFRIFPQTKTGEKLSRKHRIGIVRDPYVQFANMWVIEHLEEFFKRPLNQFVRFDKSRIEEQRKNDTFGLSQMTFDFGLDFTLSEYEFFFHVKEFIERFDIILIVERLEESLVLLKETLNWTLEDVSLLYLNHTQLYYQEGPIPSDLIEPGIIKLTEMNMADVKLYRILNREIDLRIQKYGKGRMEEEISKLREITIRNENSCNNNLIGGNTYMCSLARPPEFNIVV